MTNCYPLTYPQRLIWLTEEFTPHTSISNNAGTIRFRDCLDLQIFETALNLVIEKNEALRLRITPGNHDHGNHSDGNHDDGTQYDPQQYLAPYQFYHLEILNFSNKSRSEFSQWEIETTLIPFNLYDAGLFYFVLVLLPGQENAFYFKFHHLIADGWAVVLITDQILKGYSELLNGSNSGPAAPSYLEYLTAEQEFLKSEKFMEGKQFWAERYRTVPDFIYLKPRNPHNCTTKSRRLGFAIPARTRDRIEHFCRAYQTSPFIFFMAIIAVFFSKITNKNDLTIGTSLLNRLNAREKNMVGMFANLAPFRFTIDAALPFADYLPGVTHEARLIMRHQRYPYCLVLEDFRKKHHLRDNLFDISLTFHNAKSIKGNYLTESTSYWHNYGHQSNALSIHISDRDNNGEYDVNFDYLVDLFTEDEGWTGSSGTSLI